MKLRIEEVRKLKGMKVQELADKIGISRQALHARIEGNMSLERVEEFAIALNCDAAELFETSSEYAHFYDPQSGEWLGIRKK